MSRSYFLDPQAGPSSAIDFAAELNPQQLAAVTASGGASLVIAGAGSGKTRTLTYRVAWLLSRGVAARNILLLTFTNKAAREMLDRVATLVPHAGAGIWGGTFHSIGNRILRRHADQIGFQPGFSIMDREDQEDMIEAVVSREGLRTTDKRFPKSGVLAEIFSLSVNTTEPLQRIISSRYRYFYPLIEQIERIHVLYEARKRESNNMDFDDLLIKVIELFQTRPEVARLYQEQFEHVLVDEYQDTNRVQAQLVDILAKPQGNIMVVGDDAQSIYSWRGANFENILKFPEYYPGAVVHKIETNYRSVPEILHLANAAISSNEKQFPKVLEATRNSHPVRPALVPLATNNQQAAFVAQRILELHDEGIALRDMAVLYRAHFHSMEVQLELTRRGIPFAITSGLRFFEQAHIKDVAAFLKFAVNPRDEISFKRIVRLLPGIGGKSAETIWARALELLESGLDFTKLHQIKVPTKSAASWTQLVHTLVELAPGGVPVTAAEMIDSVVFAVYDDYMKVKFANYDARREDLNTLASYARQFADAAEFLAQLALLGSLETSEAVAHDQETDDQITLSTVHQAKGLEWKVVFLVWLTEGMFPSARSAESPEGLEEERRLFYVAVTRCKDELYLSYPDLRLNAGYGDAFQRPSRFLEELPSELLERWDVGVRSNAPEDHAGIDPSETE